MFSVIQLLETSFSHIELVPCQEESPKGEQTGSHALSVERVDTEEGIWHAKLTVELQNVDDESPAPYTGKFIIVGKFSLHEDFPDESAEKMVYMNAGALLYGAVRETITLLSCRSLHNSIQLPTIDARTFVPKVEEVTKDEKK